MSIASRTHDRLRSIVLCLALGLPGAIALAAAEQTAAPGEQAFDAAPFGFVETAKDGKAYGIRWADPRKIRRVVVEFGDDASPPASDKVRLQYWHANWDGRPDPIQAERGAGGEGWQAMDDWTNGKWKDAQTHLQADGRRWTFTFAPTGEGEFKNLGQPGVAYRKTLKLRMISDAPVPKPARFQALTDAVCQPLTARILWGKPAEPAIKTDADDSGRLEAFNGQIRAIRPIAGGKVKVEDGSKWSLPLGAEDGIEADVLLAADPVNPRYDHTVITVRSQNRPFSFAADEVARGDRILVDDLGVLVVRGDDPITLEGYRQARKEFPGRTIYDRVFGEEEQTLSRAWNDMPLKRQIWFVHGLPGNRNAMRQDPNGEIGITNSGHWFHREHMESAKDSQRKGWKGGMLTVQLGMPSETLRGGRELLDGYLPLLRTWWQDGPVYYELSTVLDKLDGNLDRIALDDPTVLLGILRVVNTSAYAGGTARLHLRSRADDADKLTLVGDRVLAEGKDGPQLRCLLKIDGRGETSSVDNGIRWSLDLAPGQAHELFITIPSITLSDKAEIEALREHNFGPGAARVCEYWRKLAARTARIDTPEPWLNDYYKAQLQHLEINCLKDLQTPRRYAHVGTFSYGVYCNESGMMISDLDRRGAHETAAACLQTWLDFQGSVMLAGNFKSKEGLLYGANGSESGSYNKHHGYCCWNLAEHWWYTRDRKWMEASAPKLIKACDWIIRERQATMTTNPDGTRPIEYGLLPAGGLEDVQDYWYWTATNACTVWGFDSLAAALTDYGHPDAPRLVKEAKAYHDDVMAAITEARIRAPVVRLRDGTYVPKFSSEMYTRGRCIGWIREVLEGSVCLLLTGMVQPDSPEARWIVKDFEDNLYVSDRYGYSIPVFDRFWFSRGGFTMQANLLDSPIPYIQRDEIEHYLRTYFNSLCSGFFPEVRMLNEHALPELGYPAGDHFKTSDESQSTYWLRLMFVREVGAPREGSTAATASDGPAVPQDLYLGQAIPRYWLGDGKSIGIDKAATHFGPMSLRITSQVGQGKITAKLDPPTRNRPKTIYLRLRHPESKPIQKVTVNGQPWEKFDVKKEWVVLPGTVEGTQEVVVTY